MNKKDFSLLPQVRFSRSRFHMPHGVKTSMNVGTLYPIHIQEVLPGDSFKTVCSVVTRVSSAFLKPVLDTLWMDTYHFFIPYRLVYDDTEKVFGSSSPSQYIQDNLVSFPSFTNSVTVSEKTVFDYLGVKPGTVPAGLRILEARAFALTYEKWFRNENVINEIFVNKGAIVSSETPNNNDWGPTNYTGKLPKVSKRKDYFTSCLPKPQKGVPVQLGLATQAPVYGSITGGENGANGRFETFYLANASGTLGSLQLYDSQGVNAPAGVTLKMNDNNHNQLFVDLSSASAFNIDDVRFKFQLQKMLERDALYGGRYNEYLLAHYGVSNPDSRVQIPEYLGGSRIPLTVTQVAQTSEGTSTSPQANVAGYSLNGGKSKFNKGFTEHGFVLTVACIRTLHTYQQGIPKQFSRVSRNDFYDPLFANLGEMPVYTSELYVDSNASSLRDGIFGYNEAWADYRMIQNRVSGEMRSSASNSLDIWHFGDNYASAPTLSQSFIEETSANVDRTLAVSSSNQDQFICDFWFDTKAIRVMPTFSVPGLIDHH